MLAPDHLLDVHVVFAPFEGGLHLGRALVDDKIDERECESEWNSEPLELVRRAEGQRDHVEEGDDACQLGIRQWDDGAAEVLDLFEHIREGGEPAHQADD